ncbi:MAG: exodeoxyribonuclease V subunit beta [Gammaproteobacteria bacterium]|nr:exodeoxyribonuclease V subunit beta [Gammaproteobacteria bacterium]
MSLPIKLPLAGSQLIEASAGTGKTYTIALLYVRLVLGTSRHPDEGPCHARPLLPPEILVVTFTTAATKELASRIRDRLVEAATVFREAPESIDPNERDPLRQLRNCHAPETWPICARRLTVAAEWMDEAAIHTIHAWALKMLQEHAFDSGNLFQQTLQPDLGDLLSDAVSDYWRRQFHNVSLTQATAIRSVVRSPSALMKAIRGPLGRPDATLRFQGAVLEAGRLHQELGGIAGQLAATGAAEQGARDAYRRDAAAIVELLNGARADLNGNTFREKSDDDKWLAALEALEAWGGRGAPAEKFVSKLGQSRIKVVKNKTAPEHPFFKAVDAWQDALEPMEEETARLRALIIADACAAVRERLDAFLLERAELGFDDILRRLAGALQGPKADALARRIRTQFPVALIDEFQDTDPVQYELFERTYRIAQDAAESDPGTAIVLIGDPKQAIYSFRGADIHTYLQARRATAGRHWPLDRNFRSTEALVSAVNTLFLHAESHPRGAFLFRTEDDDPVPYHSIEAHGRDDVLTLGGFTATALTAWWLTEDGPLRIAPFRDTMASHAAEQIATWLNAPDSHFDAGGERSRLRPADIAILVRNRNEAAIMRAALQQRGLHSVYLSDRDSVFETDEAGDVLRWLRACAEPEDDRLVREALAAPALCRSLLELEQLQQDEIAWESHQQRFVDYREVWRRYGVLPMLRRLLHERHVPQRLLAGHDGDRRLTNLLHLAEWAQETSSTLDGEQALIRALAEHVAEPPTNEQILRLESDAELIQVVTIHSSKGLEYPIVLLPFISDWTEVSSRRGEALYHEGDEVQLEIGHKDNAKEAYALADDERLQEELRLLYVALTRARHATFVGVAPLAPGANKSPQLHRGALGYLLGGGNAFESNEAVFDSLLKLTELSEHIAIDDVDPLPACTPYNPPATERRPQAARTPPEHHFERWWIASYTALKHAGDTDTPAAPETAREATLDEDAAKVSRDNDAEDNDSQTKPLPQMPAPGTIHAFPRGPEPGTFLHDLLEAAFVRGVRKTLDEPDRAQKILDRCKVRGWDAHAPVLDRWLEAFLTTPLPLAHSDAMTLSDLSRPRPEQAFWFAVEHAATAALNAAAESAVLPGRPRLPLATQQINGLLTGFIDLVAEHDGRYYVIDWKSNQLGPSDADYTFEAMAHTVLDYRYDVQLLLYLVALHRHLQQRLPGYDYDTHVGGGLFVFLRGIGSPSRGVFHDRPSREAIETIDALLLGMNRTEAS